MDARGHLTTGFVGTPYLCQVLSRYGHLDVAYRLLNRREYPSWLYPVTQGATTIWERWDGRKPDGSFQDPGMNSLNHYAYGAIGEWMYRVVAGIEIDPAAPGYEHVLIQPQPGGGLQWVKAAHESPYGEVASEWALDGDRFTVSVAVPPNTRGTIRLPGASPAEVTESGRPVASAPGVRAVQAAADGAVVEVGSGRYRFEYPAGALAARLRAARFHVDQTLEVLLANPAARAIVDKYAPGLSSDPMIDQVKTMSLRQVAGAGNVSEETLRKIDAELRQLQD